MGPSIVRGKNNAGPTSEVLHRGIHFAFCSLPYGELGPQSLKTLQAHGSNIANTLATGCHQTGSSYRPDSQQVCKVVVELWLVVKARVSPLTSKKPIFCPKALLLPSVALLQCQSWHGPCQEWITQAPLLSTQCLPRYCQTDAARLMLPPSALTPPAPIFLLLNSSNAGHTGGDSTNGC